uniref:Reverse transcriptase domain-containing protein n=1 Tax=Amphimedon queenslandica TaxID=400682 RepID=A0A1X7UX13_AMPQE
MYYGDSSADKGNFKSKLFNQFFHSVFKCSSTYALSSPPDLPEVCLSSIDINIQDTFKALCAVNPNKAGGDATSILEPIHYIFQTCAVYADIPNKWKHYYIRSLNPALDDKKQYDCIMLDIKKAFDTVSHDLLLSKLWSCGLTGPVWHLLRNYLSD